MTAQITVIVPTYNDGRLRDCLRALDAQTVPCEVVVVDNGSDESPDAICEAHGATLVHEATPGSYAARNRGLQEATTRIIAFTDADCRPHSNWLEHLTAGIQDEVVVGDVRNEPAGSKATWTERYDVLRGFPIERYAKEGYGVTANLATTRTVIDTLGGFDARLRSSGDKDFCLRAQKAGFGFRYEPQAIVRHPARRKFSELASKYRRLEGGDFVRDSPGRRWRALVQKWLLWPIPPVRFLIGLKRDGTAPRWRDVVLIGWVLQGLRWVRAVERTRLCFGGAPRR